MITILKPRIVSTLLNDHRWCSVRAEGSFNNKVDKTVIKKLLSNCRFSDKELIVETAEHRKIALKIIKFDTIFFQDKPEKI